MPPNRSQLILAHLVGFLLALGLLPIPMMLGTGFVATLLYWMNVSDIQARVTLSEIWLEGASAHSWLNCLTDLYPWGLVCWFGGGLLAGIVSSSDRLTERRQRIARWGVGIAIGVAIGVTQAGLSLGLSTLLALILHTALILPTFFIAVGLSRRMPRFYEWLSETQVESLFRR
ncbi:MAG: hypothetical protein KatS3mg019_0128 [Fimbriimonadales bacterium]|nr:MAG: hypothetical protein KatS3mg019_0128 [Fimbriimonadales bacterium]